MTQGFSAAEHRLIAEYSQLKGWRLKLADYPNRTIYFVNLNGRESKRSLLNIKGELERLKLADGQA